MILDAIQQVDDDVSMTTGYVLAYSYLDGNGDTCYGVRVGGEERALGLLGLTVVAQRHVFDLNIDDEDDGT